MKIAYLLPVASFTLVSAYPGVAPHPMFARATKGEFVAPGPNDVRSPCPALNSLANHGHIPRNGKGITFDHIVHGFVDILGLGASVAKTLATGALVMGNDADCKDCKDGGDTARILAPHLVDAQRPTIGEKLMMGVGKIKTKFGVRNNNDWDAWGNPTLDLDELSKHNKIEHDASLLRLDANLGDNTSVNPGLLQKFLAMNNTEGYITKKSLGEYRGQRYHDSKSTNKEFRFKFGPGEAEGLAFGESAVLVGLFGDPKHDYDLKADVVATFLGEDRLPEEQGWVKREVGGELGFPETLKFMAYLKVMAGIFDS